MLITDRIRFKDTGLPVPDGTEVEVRRITGNALVGTTTTADGYFTLTADGYPGAVYYTATVGTETFEHSSLSTGPARGIQIGELEDTLTVIPSGIVDGIDGELAATTTGTGLSVSVAAGAYVFNGLTYRQYAARTLTFVPASPYNTETNTYPVIVRFHDDTSTTPWATELLAINYPVDALPAPPVGATDHIISRVRIAPGATSLTAADITNATERAGDVTVGDVLGFDNAVWAHIRDRVLVGAGLTKTVDETNDNITIAPTGDNVVDAEAVQDIVAAFIKAGSNITTVYNDSANTFTISAASGGGGGSAIWKDTNFNYSGGLTAQRELGEATVSLSAGTWFIETQTHFQIYGNGTGIFNIKLQGNGTPQGTNQSSRNLDYNTGWMTCLLTGRHRVTPTTTTTYKVEAIASPVSGATASMGSGVVFIKASRES